MAYKDKEAGAEYKRRWNKANREKMREYDRAYREANREKVRESKNRWAKENPEKVREKKLMSNYGITLADYDRMLERQGGVCAICGGRESGNKMYDSLCVDHDHDTGLIRGLLCHPCNSGVGKLGDNLANLRKAVAYLENHYSTTQDPCPAKDSPQSTMPANSARVQMVLPLGVTGASIASCASGMSQPPTSQ